MKITALPKRMFYLIFKFSEAFRCGSSGKRKFAENRIKIKIESMEESC